jgi:hypothetical protein
VIEAHEVSVGLRITRGFFSSDHFESMELPVVLLGGSRNDLVEDNMDRSDNLIDFWNVDLVAAVIIGVAGMESGISLVVEVLSASGLRFQHIGLASQMRRRFRLGGAPRTFSNGVMYPMRVFVGMRFWR